MLGNFIFRSLRLIKLIKLAKWKKLKILMLSIYKTLLDLGYFSFTLCNKKTSSPLTALSVSKSPERVIEPEAGRFVALVVWSTILFGFSVGVLGLLPPPPPQETTTNGTTTKNLFSLEKI